MKLKKIIIIEIIIFTSLLIINISFGRYQSIIKGNATVEICEPILEISKKNNTSSVTREKGMTYEISISNYKDERTSDVSQSYMLQILSENVDLSKLNIKVYKDEEEIEIDNYKTESFILKAMEKESHKFLITIQSKQEVQEEIKGNIKIKVTNIQLEPEME